MVKLVYTYALGAYASRRAGSSPVSGTKGELDGLFESFFLWNNKVEWAQVVRPTFSNSPVPRLTLMPKGKIISCNILHTSSEAFFQILAGFVVGLCMFFIASQELA